MKAPPDSKAHAKGSVRINMKQSIPIRHHYIPQFILRAFLCDEKHLLYFDKTTGELSQKLPSEVFVEPNLYRDDINHSDTPMQIESDLAQFENEAARIIKEFRDSAEITIAPEDEERLKLFFAIMGFRAKRVAEAYKKKTESEEYDPFMLFQGDGNMTDFWKRNLAHLTNCRSLEDVVNNPNIDEPIKRFVQRDTDGLAGTYFIILESRGKESFIIGDCYPVEVRGETNFGIELPLYAIFPLSPKRLLLLVSNGAENAPFSVSRLGRPIFNKTISTLMDGAHKYNIKKVYTAEVEYLNSLIFKDSTEGIIIQKTDNIKEFM